MKSFIIHFLLFLTTQLFAVDEKDFTPTHMVSAGFTVISKNVGQGNCTIIRNHANNHILLIDAGSKSDQPKLAETLIMAEFGFAETHEDLPSTNNRVIVVVSHSDEDHINFFNTFAVNTGFLTQVGRIYLGDHLSNYYRIDNTRALLSGFFQKIPGINNDTFISLSHDLTGLTIADYLNTTSLPAAITSDRYRGFISRFPIANFFTQQQLDNPKNACECIGVNAGAKATTDTNANSAVVRLCIDGHNIIIMGDATGITTTKILEAISDPTILKTDLLIASHHGADTEDTNYIAWAAVTQPKRVVFSSGFHKGYKHPTLAALANYLITGLADDRMYPEALRGNDLLDQHSIFIYNTIGAHYRALSPHIHGLEFEESDQDHKEWIICTTTKPVYTTNSSGELRFVFSAQGLVHYFLREK